MCTNLPRVVGSLICTGPTGSGLPVLEFLSLTETKDADSEVLNPLWCKIEAFIIDEDFTEWGVLEKLFPNATVFLCQFT
ncbi:TPA: hypothetical protein N0F65_009230 [Lagenidium giganteum]|uniref:ZSWIM1/3 RNaseH-like domain-containing protein n=1 Tax=Lagenidium giganteum TaxID=4803 RepID=A0AAV2YNQ0_9STRA|nr:TPA: hypothetical protein N0F65_009230 [Lagenidium giganteum]